MPDDALAPLSADELADVERAHTTLKTIPIDYEHEHQIARAERVIFNALPRLLAMAQRDQVAQGEPVAQPPHCRPTSASGRTRRRDDELPTDR